LSNSINFGLGSPGRKGIFDLHLVVARYTPVVEVHELCDVIEDEISEKLHETHVLIHAEPCCGREVECPVEEGLADFCQHCQLEPEAGDQRPDDGSL